MKMNIKGLVFVGFAAAVFASAANAETGDNKKVTSKQFTEATYQAKTLANHSGDVLKMASDTAGDIGYTGVDTTVTADSPNLITSGAVADALSSTNSTIGTGTLSVTVGSANAVDFSANEATGTTVSISVPVKNGAGEGLVPSTGANDADKFLKSDGSWDTPEDTTYSAGTYTTITGANNTIDVTVDGAVASGNTGIVSGGTVYTAVEARVPKQIGSASDEGKVLVVDNAGQVSLAAAADTYQKKLTAGDFINIANDGTITTTYSAGTNVNISNSGVITATDTTYTADGTTVEIDANNQIKAKTATITGATDQATLTTGGQVAAYLDGKVIPALSTCTAYPCALVATSASAYAWEPIQQ